MKLRVLSADDIRHALRMPDAIEAVKAAYRQLSSGRTQVPLRSRIEVQERSGVALFMPALLEETGDLVLKTVSVFPENAALGLPTIHALVTVIDWESGRPVALMEGASLTAIRTGAGSGAASDILARSDASVLAIFGSGVQARTQCEAMLAVREIEAIWIYGLDPESVQRFARDIRQMPGAPDEVSIAETPKQAVERADVICTATTSSIPVFDGADLLPGTHINAIGSFTPEMQEIDSGTIAKAVVTVDSREAVLAESGDLLVPLQEGLISEDHVQAEIGEVLAGGKSGRDDPEQITVFKSVGVAVQDAAAASLALERAEALGLGQLVEL